MLVGFIRRRNHEKPMNSRRVNRRLIDLETGQAEEQYRKVFYPVAKSYRRAPGRVKQGMEEGCKQRGLSGDSITKKR